MFSFELYVFVGMIVAISIPMFSCIWGKTCSFHEFMSKLIFGIMCGVFWVPLIPVGIILLIGRLLYHTAKGFRILIKGQ